MKSARVLSAAVCAVASSQAQSLDSAQSSNEVSLRVEATGKFYQRMPCWVALTISNETDRPIELVDWGLWQGPLPITLRFTNTDGLKYASQIYLGAFWSEAGDPPSILYRPKVVLAPKEVSRRLCGLAFVFDHMQTPAGSYTGAIQLWKDERTVIGTSPPFSFELLPFPEQELMPVTAKAGVDYAGFRDSRPAVEPADVRAIGNRDVRGIVMFALLLKRIESARDLSGAVVSAWWRSNTEMFTNNRESLWPQLTTLAISDYQSEVPSAFQPEMTELEYELLRVKGDKQGASVLKERILSRYPAMKRWVEKAENGNGLVPLIQGFRPSGDPAVGRR